jgi:hypothetical protein
VAKRKLLLAGIWLVLLTWLNAAWGEPPSSLVLASGSEVTLRTYSANGDQLLLWFACDEGLGTREAQTARILAAHALETWLPDMLGAHFLPTAPSSMEQVPAEEVSEVIGQAIKRSGKKKLVLITSSRGALPILKGVKLWQEQATASENKTLAGAILFYPDLYSVTPAPGVEAQYHPIATQTTLPLFIYQGQRSPGRWWLEHLKTELARGGSQVKSRVLPNVRGYFYVRQDATPEENALAEQLPELIQDALKQLDTLSTKPEAQP